MIAGNDPDLHLRLRDHYVNDKKANHGPARSPGSHGRLRGFDIQQFDPDTGLFFPGM